MKKISDRNLSTYPKTSFALLKPFVLALVALALLSNAALTRANTSSATGEFLDLYRLKQEVLAFSLDHYGQHFPDYDIDATVVQLDSRTRLRVCSQPLSFEPPKVLNRSGNSLISVRCNGEHSWRIFVPVRVSVLRDVLVASGPIARNAPVNASNTQLKKISLNSFRDDYITDVSALASSIAKRSIRDGQPITTNQLTTPTLVKRGDAVVISAKAGLTEVKIVGIAQGAGKKGEQILVKNSQSKRTLRAIVTGKGRVSVLL